MLNDGEKLAARVIDRRAGAQASDGKHAVDSQPAQLKPTINARWEIQPWWRDANDRDRPERPWSGQVVPNHRRRSAEPRLPNAVAQHDRRACPPFALVAPEEATE